MKYCGECGESLSKNICGKCKIRYVDGKPEKTLDLRIQQLTGAMIAAAKEIAKIKKVCKHNFHVAGRHKKVYYSEFSDYGRDYYEDYYECIYCGERKCD